MHTLKVAGEGLQERDMQYGSKNRHKQVVEAGAASFQKTVLTLGDFFNVSGQLAAGQCLEQAAAKIGRKGTLR